MHIQQISVVQDKIIIFLPFTLLYVSKELLGLAKDKVTDALPSQNNVKILRKRG